MRAREFVINVPITIKINGDQDPEINVPTDSESQEEPAFVSPQQQEIELKKASLGKQSPIGNQLLDDAEEGEIS